MQSDLTGEENLDNPTWITNTHIGLISCTRQKQSSSMLAKDLYIGKSFLSGRSILERICDRWYILSAKHGLVRPDASLEPYDLGLNNLSETQYGAWCERMALMVARMHPTEVTIIAPDLYAGYVVQVLAAKDVKINRRPRVDIHGMWQRWYMSCRQCGMCGPLRWSREHAVDDAVGHPCRVEG